MSTGVVADGRLVAKPFVTPAAIVVTENYIVMLIYDENSEPPFVAACQPFNANVLLMENSFSFPFSFSFSSSSSPSFPLSPVRISLVGHHIARARIRTIQFENCSRLSIKFDDLIPLHRNSSGYDATYVDYLFTPRDEREREKKVSMKSKKLERCFQEFRREYFRRSMNLQPLFNGVHP